MTSYLIQPDLTKSPEVYDASAVTFTFPLDPFQQHAVSAIQQEQNVLVCAKTGSGKTLVGEYQIHYSLAKHKRIFYTTPIKSLSNQKFYDLVHQFPEATVGIMTGDIKFRPDAQIIVMTTEILRNLLYKKGTQTESLGLTASLSLEGLDAVVFDECHYINDPDRGKVWEETMILLPPEVKLIMLSATLDHPELFADWLGALKQRPIQLIQTSYRIVPLTHTILDSDKFLTIMDAKETFHDKIYSDWIHSHEKAEDDHKQFQKAVRAHRLGGGEGPVAGKTRPKDFTHQMNEAIGLLHSRGLTPALFFVLSRKGCEDYAHRVQHDLLTSTETAQVNQIINFHLSRYKGSLETLPQFHKLCDLLKRGIAFHHSGLLPLLKEIVEILFTRGFVRLLFATETFAVGLNMPTKTVVFTGLKKFDEQTGGMRLLRTDEYTQMAGRAGRRGKDKEGLVIYLPDREPLDISELRQIMKGARQPVQSRMDFHYDFLLKTLQADSLQWLSVMEKSYWFRQRKALIQDTDRDIAETERKLAAITTIVSEDCFADLANRKAIEGRLKQSTNSAKKEAQRQLSQWDNTHMGAKWVNAQKQYAQYLALKNQLTTLEADKKTLSEHHHQLEPIVKILETMGRLQGSIEDTRLLSRDNLTLRGVLATEVNEGHSILMPELFLSKKAEHLSGEELIAVLSCFLEFDEKMAENGPTTLTALNVSSQVKDVLAEVDKMASGFLKMEHAISPTASPSDFWELSLTWIEPIQRWLNEEHIALICQGYGIFEGNFTRAILKVNNLLDEWIAMATFCGEPAQIEAAVAVKAKLVRDVVLPESLYLRL